MVRDIRQVHLRRALPALKTRVLKTKLTPYAESMCESGFACLLTMVQGNVLAVGASHWLVASQTGLLSGVIVGTTVIAAKLRRPWLVSLTVGAATTVADAVVHRAALGAASLLEAAITGVGAFVLALCVGATLRQSGLSAR